MTATEKKVNDILQEYQALYEAINMPENQSFYFLKAIESKKNKLQQLKKEYEDICSNYNKQNIKQLKAELSVNLREKEELKSSPRGEGFAGAVRRKSFEDAVNYLKDFIEMKENNFQFPSIKICNL